MVLLVIVPFLNEEAYLPALLASIAAQTRVPDRLVLVDDGSSDRSPDIAAAFAAEHPYARVLRRPVRPPAHDRLATAQELLAFQWALTQETGGYDILVKLDADLRLPPEYFADAERRFERDPTLGLTGAYLSVVEGGRAVRERWREDHIRGPNKFYRRECYADIAPLPAFLGWDNLDEVRARMHGWRTASFEATGGDPVHLRPTGAHDGTLRGLRRGGVCAWGWGAHPLHVVLVAVSRMKDRPRVIGGLSWLLGWVTAAVRRLPRAGPDERAFVRGEELRRIRTFLVPRWGRWTRRRS